MDDASFVAQVREQGDALADLIGRLSPTDPVPTCPGWTVQHLTTHLAGVTGYFVACCTEPPQPGEPDVPVPPTDWADLLTWWNARRADLLTLLETRAPTTPVWTPPGFAPELRTWTRRAAHELAIHRLDLEHTATGSLERAATGPLEPGAAGSVEHDATGSLERAAAGSMQGDATGSVTHATTHSPEQAAAGAVRPGVVPSLVSVGFAVDGVDELFSHLLAPVGDVAGTVDFLPTDHPGGWRLTLTPHARPTVTRVASGAADAAAGVRGPAEQLYRAAWGRPHAAEVTGDRSLVAAVRTP